MKGHCTLPIKITEMILVIVRDRNKNDPETNSAIFKGCSAYGCRWMQNYIGSGGVGGATKSWLRNGEDQTGAGFRASGARWKTVVVINHYF